MSEDGLDSFLKTGQDWGRLKTSIPGIFILKMPPYKSSPARIAVEVNPVDSSGRPSKKMGLILRFKNELEQYKELVQFDKLDSLLDRVERVNPSTRTQETGGTGNKVLMRWTHLRHNGVTFPPPYNYRGLSIKVRGERVLLNPEQEEQIYAWVKKRATPYFTDPTFISNFMTGLKSILPPAYAAVTIDDMDLSEVLLLQESEAASNLTKEDKKKLSQTRKVARLKLKETFGYVDIDGEHAEIANYMVEPPGLFMGRGDHPMRGHWKPRIYPEDVTLNLDEESPIPPGGWGKIVHDRESVWVACWIDRLSDKMKYVWPSDSSSIRQERDQGKYDVARGLEKFIPRLQRHIRAGLRSRDERERRIATVCYLIDSLSMRVGDEKDEDEADTVGASTLRIEHLEIGSSSVNFNFLGKDSVLWQKSIPMDSADPQFVSNLKSFSKGKLPSDPLFSDVRSAEVNRFFGRAMKGLTAKVFRTFHATMTVREYLREHDVPKGMDDHEKLFQAKMANLKAAIRCNHKRTPPKNFDESLRKKAERLVELKAQKPKTEKASQNLKGRIRRLELVIDLSKNTREYNLNTSLRNYIDPRIYRSWAAHMGLDWTAIYTATLQRKLSWAARSRAAWQDTG